MFAVDRGCLSFAANPLNSWFQNSSLWDYRMIWSVFRYLDPFRRGSWVRQWRTDGRTDIPIAKWRALLRCAAKNEYYSAHRLDLSACCVRLSRVLVGFRTHFKSLHFHSLVHSFIDLLIHLFIDELIYSFIHLFIHSFIHSFVHFSFIHAFIYLFIHSYCACRRCQRCLSQKKQQCIYDASWYLQL